MARLLIDRAPQSPESPEEEDDFVEDDFVEDDSVEDDSDEDDDDDELPDDEPSEVAVDLSVLDESDESLAADSDFGVSPFEVPLLEAYRSEYHPPPFNMNPLPAEI